MLWFDMFLSSDSCYLTLTYIVQAFERLMHVWFYLTAYAWLKITIWPFYIYRDLLNRKENKNKEEKTFLEWYWLGFGYETSILFHEVQLSWGCSTEHTVHYRAYK